MQNSNTNDREVVEEAAKVFLKELDAEDCMWPEDDEGIIKAFVDFYNKIQKSQSKALPLTDDELEKLGRIYAEDIMEGENTPVKLYKSDLEDLACKCYKDGYKANRGSYTLEDIGKAFDAAGETTPDSYGYGRRYRTFKDYIASLLK